jgi:hypothetical protein
MGRLIDFLLDWERPEPFAIKPFWELADEDKPTAVREACEKISGRAQRFVSNAGFWESIRGLLEKALSAADQGEHSKAFLRLTEASALINRAEESEALRDLKIRLAVFPVLWMLGLLGFQVLARFLQAHHLFPLFSPDYFSYLWAGMIGGTTIVIWGVIKHSVELNFDRTYSFWYLLKPGIGAVMGVVAVLVLKAGFLSVEGKIPLANPLPLVLLAFIAGFSERFFLRILDRVITALFGGDTSVSVQSLILRPAGPSPSGDSAEEGKPGRPNASAKTNMKDKKAGASRP